MALEFRPYGELYQGMRMEQDQRRGGIDRINQTLQGINQQSLRSIEERKAQERQAMLDKLLFDKQDMDRQQHAYEYGTPIDPNIMSVDPSIQGPANMGRSSFMPNGSGPVSTNASPLIEQFNKWRAGGMGKATAQPEFMPALGRDERKMMFDRDNPKPVANYVIPNIDASGNVSGFTPLPTGSKPAGGMAKPPTPPIGMSQSGMRLPPASVLAVNEGKSVARMLPEVEQALIDNKDIFGPISGRSGALNPYDTTAQTVDARMRTASQAFGRFMEGGVLRKEDEEKYRKMFPQLSDTPMVAQNKLSIVRRMLAQQYDSQRQSLADSNYDVSGLGSLEIPPSIFGTSNKQAPIVQRNRKTGQIRISTDGGKTWKIQ